MYSMGFMTVEELEKVIDLYAQGKLDVLVDKTYPFELEAIKKLTLISKQAEILAKDHCL